MLFWKSVLCAALILFQFSTELWGAMPLTETINTLSEGDIELGFREEFLRQNGKERRETYMLGMGVLPFLSIWFSFQYLHRGLLKTEADELGDSFFRVWFYIDDYLEDSLHLGFLLWFRIPTGVDAYTSSEWRNLALGNNELKFGPVFQCDIYKGIYIHINTFYIFRQGSNEGFYNGFYINLVERETYSKLFGLNFQSEDTFLAKDRLKNDYVSFSLAVNTDLIYPLIAYAEFYGSRRIYTSKETDFDEIPIEGAGINPILLSIGCRYFFSESLFLGFYYIVNPKREENFIEDIFSIDFSLQF